MLEDGRWKKGRKEERNLDAKKRIQGFKIQNLIL